MAEILFIVFLLGVFLFLLGVLNVTVDTIILRIKNENNRRAWKP